MSRLGQGGKQFLNSTHGLRGEQNVSAYIALVSGDVVDDDDVAMMSNRVVDEGRLVGAGTTEDGAFHGWVSHGLGG